MPINSTHPQYDRYQPDWELMRDSYQGERAVKEKGTKYLPPTTGMVLDGMSSEKALGWQAYLAYRQRAVYPEYVSEAIESLIGMLHRQPAEITLPAGMESMLEHATVDGEELAQLHRRISERQLLTGRLGLFLDLPAGETTSSVMPYIAMYEEKDIINWDSSDDSSNTLRTALNLVVLDESGPVRDAELVWKERKKYRILVLGDLEQNESENAGARYRFAVAEGEEVGPLPDEAQYTEPMLRGRVLEQIPFVFINSKDNVSDPDDPPLLSLANLCMAIYRGEADYRQSLHLQGQDTLVISDDGPSTSSTPEGGSTWRTGAGATIELGAGGKAEYIGVSSAGLPEQRAALAADHQRASLRAGQLIDTRSAQRESGEALQTRIAAQTASLVQIAKSGAAGLQAILRIAATWLGLDPLQVVVKPNLDFGEVQLTGKDMVDLTTARRQGFPISDETMHALLVEKGMTKFTYDEERDLVEAENAANRGPDMGRGLPEDGGDDE